jgi:hypothetical protein
MWQQKISQVPTVEISGPVKMGVPPNHPFDFGMLQKKRHHPAIGLLGWLFNVIQHSHGIDGP